MHPPPTITTSAVRFISETCRSGFLVRGSAFRFEVGGAEAERQESNVEPEPRTTHLEPRRAPIRPLRSFHLLDLFHDPQDVAAENLLDVGLGIALLEQRI